MADSAFREIDAADVDPTIAEDGAILIVTTADNERVGVRMSREVFAHLFERMVMAMEKADAEADAKSGGASD